MIGRVAIVPAIVLLAGVVGATKPEHQFVTIQSGEFKLGTEGARRNPPHTIQLKSFEIATTETTNAQFAQFIEATGYKTDAEKRGTGKTFHLGLHAFEWEDTPGATWRFPNGEKSGGIADKMNHPITQISMCDARAYCKWAGVRLPTTDEWEVAARGDATTAYYWGANFEPDRVAYANTWDGDDYTTTTLADGFMTTAPVASFKPNALGLYDVIGNVFEYCEDVKPNPDEYPKGGAGRGGSWWCSPHSCNFHNLTDVGRMEESVSISNQGFRVARDESGKEVQR